MKTRLYLYKFDGIHPSTKNEHFYKLGITTQEVMKDRFTKYGNYTELYKITRQHSIAFGSFKTAEEKEQRILNECKDIQYWPKVKFSGYTECLQISVKNRKRIVRMMSEIAGRKKRKRYFKNK